MRLLLLLLLCFPLPAAGQGGNPFQRLKFDEVLMYDFGGVNSGHAAIVNESGTLATSISRQVTLDPATVKALNQRLGSRDSYGGKTASCFDPHLGFVYFLKGKIVAHISVCLDCNQLRSTIPVPGQQQGQAGQGKQTYYIAAGLSPSFRQFLNGLLVLHGFSHTIKKRGEFDE